jgi:hypothetical protein
MGKHRIMSVQHVRRLPTHVISRMPRARSANQARLARGGFWSLVGDAGSRAFSFMSAIIVARWLGVAEFGAFP